MRLSLLLPIAVLVVYLSYSEGWRKPWRRPRIPWRRPRIPWRRPRIPWRVRTVGRDVPDESVHSDQNEMRDTMDERQATVDRVVEALQTLAERHLSDGEQD
ncbi:uncharacterized protein LOC124153068 [Haliotis rufescens]|uniref:uncharacterized protein LOC124153068 n=1 Tax=Haliotis rufescens TaxID=6454 RepID=UPI001EB00513|nr:uncharacterized protein LOC124153068 [Haliotis rufescens]